MASEFSKDQPEPVSDWDEVELVKSAEKAQKLNAHFSNRIFVQPDGLHLRMTFGEQVGTERVFHSSIVVPNADALEFGKLIVRMAEAGLEQQAAFWKEYFTKGDGENGE